VYDRRMGISNRRSTLAAIGVLALVGLAGCGTRSSDGASTTTQPPTTVSSVSTATSTPTTTAAATTTTPTTATTAATTTTSSSTTTSSPTTTTSSSTTTVPDAVPATVSGLTVTMGGGSGEVIPEWDRGGESDLDHYNIWYSQTPGATKTLLASVGHDPGTLTPPAYDAGGGRTAYVDYPRAQAENTECYQISVVDAGDHESARSGEVCLPGFPPGVVTGVTVGIGGGSGEVFLSWARGAEPDLDHYNIWYSELPGESKSLLATVAHPPGSLTSPAYDAGGGVTAYIDYPRELRNDKQCYEISPVDTNGNEGPRTTELCLSGL
jgi:hypothetical protein